MTPPTENPNEAPPPLDPTWLLSPPQPSVAEAADLDPNDARMAAIVDLIGRGEYVRAARQADQALHDGAMDIRLVGHFLCGTFVEQGAAALPLVVRVLLHVLGPGGESIGPTNRREAHVESMLLWLFSAMLRHCEFAAKQSGDAWQAWTLPQSRPAIDAALAQMDALKSAVARVSAKGRSTTRLQSLEAWLRAVPTASPPPPAPHTPPPQPEAKQGAHDQKARDDEDDDDEEKRDEGREDDDGPRDRGGRDRRGGEGDRDSEDDSDRRGGRDRSRDADDEEDNDEDDDNSTRRDYEEERRRGDFDDDAAEDDRRGRRSDDESDEDDERPPQRGSRRSAPPQRPTSRSDGHQVRMRDAPESTRMGATGRAAGSRHGDGAASMRDAEDPSNTDAAMRQASPEWARLVDKLQAFEWLVSQRDYMKAAVVATDVQAALNSFDPVTYFPSVFAGYLAAFSDNLGPLETCLRDTASLQFKILQKLYQVSPEKFLK